MKSWVLLFAFWSLAAASSVQAKTTHLGFVDGTTAFAEAARSDGSSFAAYVKFKLSELYDMKPRTVGSGVNGLSTAFAQRSSAVRSNAKSPFTSSFSHALSRAKYRFGIDAATSPRVFGAWLGSMSAAAVPEADSWLMLLIGAGLVGYQLFRKHRSLQQPFAA
jgi:hypothetical protein